ncbi:MAG: response regulator [Lachnospiraceae bacterium]|nr:response regulator [Lachnospiraceae bacterium]
MYKVLIVDDAISDAENMRRYIPWNQWNCQVVATADNGFDGYQKALQHKPDIVISDVSMPVKNGLEMAEMIYNALEDTYFIFISCYPSFEYAQTALKLKAFSYILKPVKLAELRSAILNISNHIAAKQDQSQKKQELINLFEQNKAILLENYLVSLLLTDNLNAPPHLGLNMKSRTQYSLLLVRIALHNQPEENPYILQMYLKELCGHSLKNSYIIPLYQDIVVILADVQQNPNLIDNIIDIRQNFYQEFPNLLTVYLSETEVTFTQASSRFRHIIEIIDKNVFEETGTIIFVNENLAEDFSFNVSSDMSTLIADLYVVLSQNTDITSFVNKYYSHFPQSAVYLKTITFSIVCYINTYLTEQNHSLNSIFDDSAVVWNKLSNFESISNIRQWIYNILKSAQEFLCSSKSKSDTSQIANKIKQCIISNYSDYDVLQKCATENQISLNYANILFKKCFDQTMFDFLVFYRLSQAKKLLTDTDFKIARIASMVGYASHTYFSTAFKQHVGMSPNEYRDANRSTEVTDEKQ